MAAKQSSNVLSRAVNVLGTPYRWGGSSPSKGFDCSGLVKYAFTDVDEDLRRSIARIEDCPFLPHRTGIRGFVYDVDTGLLREVTR